jgi:hypothetical protein
MPRKGGLDFVGGYSRTIIRDADEALSAIADFYSNLTCVSIDRVFDQFFDDRGGSLDHLAGGNLRARSSGRIWMGTRYCNIETGRRLTLTIQIYDKRGERGII